VDELVRDLNSLWVLAAAVSAAIAVAAWALQLACGFCSVEPPTFTRSVVTVVIMVACNVLLRVVLQLASASEGIWADYAAPAIAVSAVISICVPAGPFTALTIAVVQVALCALMYLMAGWCATLLTFSLYV
jgi:hypothetical protein